MVDEMEMSTLQDQYADASLRDEATQVPTFPKGNYNGKVVSGEEKDAPDWIPQVNGEVVKMWNLRVTLDVNGKTITKFVKVCPRAIRVMTVGGERVNIAPDHKAYSKEYPKITEAKLWGQLEALVTPKGQRLTIKEVIQAAVDSTFSFFYTESFKDKDGKYVNYKTDEERSALLKGEYTAANYCNGISKAKG
jgi:hypothetical protein